MIAEAQLTLKRLWGQLSWVQRVTIGGLAVAVIGAMALLFMWASAPSYRVLFSGLSADDAGTITAQLDASKVPYQLANGGSTILVPDAQVDSERLKLASQGLPAGGVVGFSLFDKQSVFQGDSFTEQINYTRALEGELTKTIGQISGVLYDRVNIVLPQQDLFSSDQASPTASVLLKMGLGSALTSDQVAGIQHLVASAVQGLKPDAVTVVDGSGNILSGNVAQGDATATGMTALQAQARYASNLEAQLGAMLDTVVGPDKAVVRVNAVLDWSQKDQTQTLYGPQSRTSPLTASHTTASSSIGPSNGVGGVAGLGSNVPTYGAVKATGLYTQTQSTADLTFTQPFTVTHVVAAPGGVQRLSVAVLLDGVQCRGAPGGCPSELAALRQAVSAAAGLNPGRGDQLSITSVPFDTTVQAAAVQAAASQQQRDLIVTVVRWAALIVVPLVLLFLLRRLLVPRRLREYDALEYAGVEVVEQGDAELGGVERVVSWPPGPQEVMRKSLADIAREKPEVVAGLIGRWIDEDRA